VTATLAPPAHGATTLAASATVTASSSVVLSNLAYLIGAVLLAFIFGLLVWLHHRKPKSIDANVESFNRGLRALAPDSAPRKPRHSARAQIATPPRSETVVPMRSVRLAPAPAPASARGPQAPEAPPAPQGPPPPEPAGERAAAPVGRPADPPDGTPGAAAEAPGEHAGAEPG
jgi:hypothetical protein